MNRIYPNPFNPATTIEYELTVNSHIKLAIYDILGRKVPCTGALIDCRAYYPTISDIEKVCFVL